MSQIKSHVTYGDLKMASQISCFKGRTGQKSIRVSPRKLEMSYSSIVLARNACISNFKSNGQKARYLWPKMSIYLPLIYAKTTFEIGLFQEYNFSRFYAMAAIFEHIVVLRRTSFLTKVFCRKLKVT